MYALNVMNFPLSYASLHITNDHFIYLKMITIILKNIALLVTKFQADSDFHNFEGCISWYVLFLFCYQEVTCQSNCHYFVRDMIFCYLSLSLAPSLNLLFSFGALQFKWNIFEMIFFHLFYLCILWSYYACLSCDIVH